MPKQILDLSLSRHLSSVPWGFTISGGLDQALTIKVGCVLQDSVAELCGLRTRDFIWKVNGVEVFNKTHAECVKMIKAGGNKVTLTVERGDHIVPSFQEISGRKTDNHLNDQPASNKRQLTGKAYYTAAMQSHGLPGKIPTSFTTVGKPYFENIQYNSPIEMYDDNTVDEMVKIMNSAGAVGGKAERVEETDNINGGTSNMGWTVRNVTTSNNVYKQEKAVSWSNM